VVVVVGYPEVTDAGNGGPWEWRPLGMAALNRNTLSQPVPRACAFIMHQGQSREAKNEKEHERHRTQLIEKNKGGNLEMLLK